MEIERKFLIKANLWNQLQKPTPQKIVQGYLSAATGYTLSLSTIDANFRGTPTYAASPGITHQFAYSLDG